jgi:hypothetical protein
MVTNYRVCIIHPLVTMMAAMIRTSAYFEANSEAQVVRSPRPWHMKSGAISCYMYWPTLKRWHHTWNNLFMNSGVDQGTQLHRNMIPFLERVREMDCPISFPGSNIWYMLSLSKRSIYELNLASFNLRILAGPKRSVYECRVETSSQRLCL